MTKNVKCNTETIHAICDSYIRLWDEPDWELIEPDIDIVTRRYSACFSTLICDLTTHTKIGVGITDLWLKLYNNITIHYYTGE